MLHRLTDTLLAMLKNEIKVAYSMQVDFTVSFVQLTKTYEQTTKCL